MGPEHSPPHETAPAVDSRPSKEAVREHLAGVLASPEFAERPVLRGFPSFVVEKALAGRSHEIKGHTVAVEVFGRSESFDGQKNSIVRIHAGRLRRALEGLQVVAGHSSLQLKGEKAGVRELGRRLGARFLVEGGSRREVDGGEQQFLEILEAVRSYSSLGVSFCVGSHYFGFRSFPQTCRTDCA